MTTPDTLAQLDALWRRFDMHPEVRIERNGAWLKLDAYVAFLDARKLIERLRHELHGDMAGERARVVAYLREIARGSADEDALLHAANSVESGLHWDDER